jgi:fatty-acyl-CoA synthase
MLGNMMHMPLTIGSLIDHAGRYHAQTEIISVDTSGGVEITNWKQVHKNSRRLGSVLKNFGITLGDRVATLAWNNRRHLEIYFGVSGSGMVCHTVNPRLSPEQFTYVINHAADRVLFIDSTFLPIVAALKDTLQTVETFILMGPRDEQALELISDLVFYDELVDKTDDGYDWPLIDENSASSLCYTSGTTGNPKGVLYTHRSTLLHSLAGNQPDGFNLSAKDTVLPVVPMFHVNAWGVPYVAAATGCMLVLPGPGLDGDSLVKLIDDHSVSIALGVPTIWLGLLAALKSSGSDASSLKRTVVGGSALPPSMIATFRDDYDVELIHAWGMTETSPLGTINQLLAKHSDLELSQQSALRLCQGRPSYGVELRIVDDIGSILPTDGTTQGFLQIKGHWVMNQYFGSADSAITDDGWFDTGDVATIDNDGYMTIRDRSKDIIKSGGEWISTVELENIAISHPSIANAAVIAARHEKWDERPVVIAIKTQDENVSEETVLEHYNGKIPKWQIPDRVIFVDALPIGATGKVLKNKLREEHSDVLM